MHTFSFAILDQIKIGVQNKKKNNDRKGGNDTIAIYDLI